MVRPLPRSKPEAEGVPSAALLAMVQRMEQQEVHSVMVLRRGKVLAEGWWKPFEPGFLHELFSLSKSFASTAVGLAVGERKLTLDDRVLGFFPELAPGSPSENLRQMRVRDLLTMACGHASEAWAGQDFDPADFRRSFLRNDVPHEPGKHFLYNSLATYMASAIVQHVTGEPIHAYLRPRLFEPLGIERHPWEADPNGIDMGGWGLSLTTEDIAKFGQLLLQQGEWEGRQLLPPTWVQQATAKQVENGDGGPNDWAHGYGFQFWRCQVGCYRGDGAFGQLCVVVPNLDIVVAATASVDDIQALLLCIWEELLPSVQDGPLPATGGDLLESKLAKLQLPVLSNNEGAEPNPALAGRFGSIGVVLTPANVHLEVPGGGIVAGFGAWLTSTYEEEPVAACAAWRTGGALEIKVRWLERTQGQTWVCRREGKQVRIERTQRGTLGGDAPEAIVSELA